MPTALSIIGTPPRRAARPEPDPRGTPLSAYAEPLRRVRREHETKPAGALTNLRRMVEVRRHCDETGNDPTDAIVSLIGGMGLVHLGRMSFDALCKVRHTMRGRMRDDVEALFEHSPNHFLVGKIRNSIWRWGHQDAPWNDVVAAYDGIRRFDFGLPGFEVTLDHTPGSNLYGYSHHSRTYLDGALAFLVHHKGEHALTIGFSVSRDRSLLIQQVQAKKRHGNRWMFRMPAGPMAHVVERMRAAFPGHRLLVADGGDVATHNVNGIRKGIAAVEAELRRMQAQPDADDNALVAVRREDLARMTEHRDRIRDDAPRLAAAYRNVGPHRLGDAATFNGIRHYRIHLRRRTATSEGNAAP